MYGGLNAFFLLMDEPEKYGLPEEGDAVLPSRNNAGSHLTAAVTAVLGVLGGLIALPLLVLAGGLALRAAVIFSVQL